MAAAEPTHSPWRLEARRVIAGVLAGLPADAPPALVRKALRDAYPFGPRKYHPYRCWCVEVRRALGVAMHPKRPDGKPAASFFLGDFGWLTVVCGACEDTIAGGCLVCVAYHAAAREVVALREWPGWRDGLVTDRAGTLPYLADWLEERGHGLLAGWCRAQGGAGDG